MDDNSFQNNVGFWIKNLQLRIPESVVLLVGTHVDKCTDDTEVKEKKNHIEEQVKEMLDKHTANLKHRRKYLENMEEQSLYCDQINQIERLTEYKLKVIWFCNYCLLKHAANKICCHDLHLLLFSGSWPCTYRLHWTEGRWKATFSHQKWGFKQRYISQHRTDIT